VQGGTVTGGNKNLGKRNPSRGKKKSGRSRLDAEELCPPPRIVFKKEGHNPLEDRENTSVYKSRARRAGSAWFLLRRANFATPEGSERGKEERLD